MTEMEARNYIEDHEYVIGKTVLDENKNDFGVIEELDIIPDTIGGFIPICRLDKIEKGIKTQLSLKVAMDNIKTIYD